MAIPKCKNCQLFDRKNNLCQVKILIEGEHQQMPVESEDDCFWITTELEVERALKEQIKHAPVQEIKQKLMGELDVPIAIKSLKMWSDGKNGFLEHKG